jgi:hypothetical protein
MLCLNFFINKINHSKIYDKFLKNLNKIND